MIHRGAELVNQSHADVDQIADIHPVDGPCGGDPTPGLIGVSRTAVGYPAMIAVER
ncbi:hypothetical protein HMPREF0290_2890 [Corynebacterium efficiens YS-314]|nr:hypothetical protein HMPREF0290_2890 [Corynebacterium efficiens YS-314]